MFGPTVSPQLMQSGRAEFDVSCRSANLPRPSMAGAFFRLWQRRTNIWREVTSPAQGLTRPTSEEPYWQRGAISCANALEFIFMKPSALLAVALVAFGVWAWHVVPDYVSSTSSSPRSAATDSACRCQGCGCKGGPGWRGQNGQCVSHANLTKDCGSPPSTRCTYEGARQVCPSRG
jgi:hypothetical protein